MLGKWEAIVFDLDDTLYLERDFVMSGFHAVAKWSEQFLSIPEEVTFKELKSLFNQGIRGNIFNLLLESHDLLADEVVEKMISVYREHNPSISPFPDVKGVLIELKKYYFLGIISDGYLEVQERKLNALGIEDFFDAVIFTDEWGKEAWKPNKKSFELISCKFNVSPSQCIYVADNPEKDFFGAKKIGMYTIRVVRQGGLYSTCLAPTTEHEPDLTINSLKELLNIGFIVSSKTKKPKE